MKIRPIMFNATWNLRKGGGLFLGLKVHFPVRCIFSDDTTRSFVNITVGLLVFTVGVDFVSRPLVDSDGGLGL